MKNKIYYKVAQRQFMQSALIWFSLWICTCFVKWEIVNPFQWLIDMPKYQWEARLTILMFVIMYYSVSIDLIHTDEKSKI
jgi:hypothetical protein